jgi:archaellum biogenesis ATPase FlaH
MTIENTLERFGSEFQQKCIVALLTDRTFLEQVYDIVNEQYFENPSNQWIVKKLKWYFHEYRQIPSKEVLGKEWTKIPDESDIKLPTKQQIMNVLMMVKTPPSDLAYIKDEFLAFCKNQELKNAILKSAELLAGSRYEDIKTLIDKAMRAGQERNIGHDWNVDIESRVSKHSRNTIATPWAALNELLDGGLGKGEVGCVIAPQGIGKSWLLDAIGMHAVQQGKRVVHYTLELSQEYTGLRYDTILTGIQSREIKDNVGVVRSAIDELTGQLIIKYFPTKSVTTNALMAHAHRMIQLDQRPDMIIVDYLGLLRGVDKGNAKHEELGNIIEELRGMAGELEVPLWTAHQTQRSSQQDEIIEGDKVAGAYSILAACDVWMSLSRLLADKMENTGRVFLGKNRFGKDGIVLPAFLDFEHGKIEVYNEDSPEGRKVKHAIENGKNNIQDRIEKKLIEFNDLTDGTK